MDFFFNDDTESFGKSKRTDLLIEGGIKHVQKERSCI